MVNMCTLIKSVFALYTSMSGSRNNPPRNVRTTRNKTQIYLIRAVNVHVWMYVDRMVIRNKSIYTN
jgi:hypothetical protein